MYSQSDIEDAVAGGALTAEQAASLRNHVATRTGVPTVDEEYFRFFTGFNDLFATVAVLFAIVAAGWLGSQLPPNVGGPSGPSPFMGLLAAGAAWGLAEIFTRQRRNALTSIVLAWAFVYTIAIAVALILAEALGEQSFNSPQPIALLMAGCALTGGAAGYAHWRRFKVPVTISIIAGMVTLAVIAVVASNFYPDPTAMMTMTMSEGGYAAQEASMARFMTVLQISLLIAGLATFAYAMWWDGRDRRRETADADVAFWLHVSAAFMIVHSLFSLLGVTEGTMSSSGAIVVLLLYGLFCVVALIIDRRVVLLAGLGYLLWALNSLLNAADAARSSGMFGMIMSSVLIVGAILVLLAVFWSQLRQAIVGVLPEGLQARVPVIDRPAAQEAEAE